LLSATKLILSVLFSKKQIEQINIKKMQRYLRPSSWEEKHWKKKATQLQHSAPRPNCDVVFSQKLGEEQIEKAKISAVKEKPKIKRIMTIPDRVLLGTVAPIITSSITFRPRWL